MIDYDGKVFYVHFDQHFCFIFNSEFLCFLFVCQSFCYECLCLCLCVCVCWWLCPLTKSDILSKKNRLFAAQIMCFYCRFQEFYATTFLSWVTNNKKSVVWTEIKKRKIYARSHTPKKNKLLAKSFCENSYLPLLIKKILFSHSRCVHLYLCAMLCMPLDGFFNIYFMLGLFRVFLWFFLLFGKLVYFYLLFSIFIQSLTVRLLLPILDISNLWTSYNMQVFYTEYIYTFTMPPTRQCQQRRARLTTHNKLYIH